MPEASRKHIALGTAFFLTVIIIGGSFAVSSVFTKKDIQSEQEEVCACIEFYEVGKDVASDVMYYVVLGWGDVTSKVFSN